MYTDLVSLASLTGGEIIELLDLADELKRFHRERRVYRPLEGQSLAMIFEKPSLRTRVTFETGMFQLGGQGLMIHSENTRLGERETVPDVARNLERWVDGIMARTFSHEAVEQLAEHANIPVINGLTDKLHPCQILADAQTLREHRGEFANLKLAFVGDGNNVAASWLEFAARVPLNVTIVCPKGYEPEADIVALARRDARGEVVITQDIESGLKDASAVYTDVWASMGQEDEQDERCEVFMPYQVNAKVMALAAKDALFMHCLPAKRGKEVTDDVVDGPQSVVFDEAENRLHSQKAVLVALMQRGADGLTRKQRYRSGGV